MSILISDISDIIGLLGLLKNKTVAIIGYGSQGRAHALNLKDSGVQVIVGLYAGSNSWKKAIDDGLFIFEVAEAVKQADLVMMLLPDEKQPQVYKEFVHDNLKPGAALAFAHGFGIHFGYIQPRTDVDVLMVAPKGPGQLVRDTYEMGQGVPALYAVHQNASGDAENLAKAYAAAIGAARAGVIQTTFKEETETDLFGEQAVLCGGVTELVKAGFDTLTKAGYQKEVAYFECLHELKLIVDLLYAGGLGHMRHVVSNTAEYGDYVTGPRVIDHTVRERMEEVLKDIQEGTFAKQWMAECESGQQQFNQMRERESLHDINKVGEDLRQMMSWIPKSK